jgi:hypothetical protein
VNWLVHATPELHLPASEDEKNDPPVRSNGPFFLRTERQTLVRLPRTGAVAFGIKTSITPIERLTRPQAVALSGALSGLEPDVVAYRAGSDMLSLAISHIDRVACGSAQ